MARATDRLGCGLREGRRPPQRRTRCRASQRGRPSREPTTHVRRARQAAVRCGRSGLPETPAPCASSRRPPRVRRANPRCARISARPAPGARAAVSGGPGAGLARGFTRRGTIETPIGTARAILFVRPIFDSPPDQRSAASTPPSSCVARARKTSPRRQAGRLPIARRSLRTSSSVAATTRAGPSTSTP